MDIQNVKISDIHMYQNNAKKHDEVQIQAIAKSIQRFGFQQPLVLDKNNEIVIGHGRFLAARYLGLEEAPCKYADDLSRADIKALRLADNKLNESAWDLARLDDEIASLGDIALSLKDFGFDIDLKLGDLDNSDVTRKDPDDVSEDVETQVKLGDIWQLGKHRLICGDSTDADVISRLMDGAKAAICLTDPPYGINAVAHLDKTGEKTVGSIGETKAVTIQDKRKGKVHGNARNAIIPHTKEYYPIIGDDTTDTARAAYPIAKKFSEDQIFFGGNYFTDFLPPSRCWLVWDKENSGSFADAELAWTSYDKVVKLYKWMWNGLCRKGDRNIEGKTRVHPTQKPVGLLGEILKDYSQEGDKILDMFGGSGSTLIACQQTGRVCYMCELDPHYCDVIIKRYEDITGDKAVCVSGSGS